MKKKKYSFKFALRGAKYLRTVDRRFEDAIIILSPERAQYQSNGPRPFVEIWKITLG